MPFAVVLGKAVTELPKDLYIPPQALEVFLEAFVESQLVAAFEQMLPETFQQRGKLLVMGFSGDADMIEQG